MNRLWKGIGHKQSEGRLGGGAAKPVNEGFMPPFQGTCCALDPSTISY